MRLIDLGSAGLRSSRLAFGTARLHHMASRERLPILHAAFDLGFRHFDTAPLYGDGMAERTLAAFLQGRRDKVVVATKYGLPPDPVLETVPALGFPWRVGRTLARRAGLSRQPRPMLSPAGLRHSVEQSLKRLQTDYLDLVLLHEPEARRIKDPDAMVGAFEDLCTQGLVRAWGLAGAWTGIRTVSDLAPRERMIVQTAEQDWDETLTPDITYGAIAASPQAYGAPSVDGSAAETRLRKALARRPNGVVLLSSTREANLARAAAIESDQP